MLLLIMLAKDKNDDVIVNIPDGKKEFISVLEENYIKYSEIFNDNDKSSFGGLLKTSLYFKLFKRLIYIIKFYFHLKKIKPDIVYLNTIRTTSELISCKLANVKTVMHLRGFDDKSVIRNYFLNLNNRIITLNHYAKSVVYKYTKNNSKIIVVPNGTKIYQLNNKQFNYKKLNFCIIGPYNHRKGTDNLYFFIKSLIKNGLNFTISHFGKDIPEDEYSSTFLKKLIQVK